MELDQKRLDRLRDHLAEYGVLPSYAAMAELIGMKSKAGVAKFVDRLCKRGLVRKGPGGRLVPTRAFFARPVVGHAPAGFPSPADELMEDAITIDDYLVDHPSRTVLVQVRGDSMLGAGIQDGDYVVVERTDQAQPGQIVVARVDGEYTIKYLMRDGDGWFLRAANPHYPDLRPQGSLDLFGIVRGQFRRYA
ncbi:MAG: LexA family transcriptional regulator [Zetaproteobacteria bacterium]|nr:MAG: LexA family transcriptional regulator [Zetaproteobacteria bacterium]